MTTESPWLNRIDAAAYLGISPRTLDRWRCVKGDGPPYYKLRGWVVRYRLDEIEAWAKKQPRRHTDDIHGEAQEILRQADIMRAARSMAGRRRS